MTNAMVAFVLRRMAAAVALAAIVASGTFLLGHFAPGDATTDLLLSGAGAKAVARERERLGLDDPIGTQFARWALGLARFDLGVSSAYGRPVTEMVAARAGSTATLAAAALAIAVGLGLPLGLLTGARPRGVAAALVTPISIALLSCPPLVGALGLSLLAVKTGWLSLAPGDLAVPALALGLPFAAMLERLQSRATADALAAPSVLAAAGRGIPPGRLLWVHVARQSLRPVLGVLGMLIGALFGGSLAVEYITGWPGLGRLMYDALTSRDLFLVAGCALLGALLLAAGNFVADLLRAWVDPRTALE